MTELVLLIQALFQDLSIDTKLQKTMTAFYIIHLTCMFLNGGNKLELPDRKTHTNTRRT